MLKLGNELEAKGHGEEKEGGKYTRIVVQFGSHRYSGESGEAEGGEEEWKTLGEIEAEQYAALTDEEQRGWRTWKNVPPKLQQ